MIVDANLLIYARHRGSVHHAAARDWLTEVLNGPVRVGLPWQSLVAFVRVSTNASLFERPLTAAEAGEQVDEWRAAPESWVPSPGPGYGDLLRELL